MRDGSRIIAGSIAIVPHLTPASSHQSNTNLRAVSALRTYTLPALVARFREQHLGAELRVTVLRSQSARYLRGTAHRVVSSAHRCG